MANLAPILLAGGALLLVAKGKKKKRKSSTAKTAPSTGSPYGAMAGWKPPPPTAKKIEELPKHIPGPSDEKAGSSKWEKRQESLIELGYDVGPTGADGVFGKNTKAAIREFQGDVGIAVDGIWGPITDSAIGMALKRLAQGIADALSPAIGAAIDSLLGTAGAVKEFGESWLGDDEGTSATVIREGSFPNAEFRVVEIDDEGLVSYAAEVRPKGHDGFSRGILETDFDSAWERAEDAARKVSDAIAAKEEEDRGPGPNTSVLGREWGPNDHIVLDGECDKVLHLSDEFLYQIQPRMIVQYALEDMTSDEDGEEIHERLLAEYAPMCASLGKDGVGEGVRHWWGVNVAHIITKLRGYALNPQFLEEDAEKYGL